MDITSEGGRFISNWTCYKDHRAENHGDMEWMALGKRSTWTTETEVKDIDTAGLKNGGQLP